MIRVIFSQKTEKLSRAKLLLSDSDFCQGVKCVPLKLTDSRSTPLATAFLGMTHTYMISSPQPSTALTLAVGYSGKSSLNQEKTTTLMAAQGLSHRQI